MGAWLVDEAAAPALWAGEELPLDEEDAEEGGPALAGADMGGEGGARRAERGPKPKALMGLGWMEGERRMRVAESMVCERWVEWGGVGLVPGEVVEG